MKYKQKISAFELAIMQVADPEKAKQFVALTKEEEQIIRKNSLLQSAKKLKIKTK